MMLRLVYGLFSGLSMFAAIKIQAGVTPDIPISLSEIISGILLLLCGYLFNSSIRQGKDIAKLQVFAQANADNIAILQGEAATIDKRITESRHGIRGELGIIIAQMEDRLDKRLVELRMGQEDIRRTIQTSRRGDIQDAS